MRPKRKRLPAPRVLLQMARARYGPFRDALDAWRKLEPQARVFAGLYRTVYVGRIAVAPRRTGRGLLRRGSAYEYLHRLVAGVKLGRALRAGEEVHHADGNRLNNHPHNLLVTDRAEHRAAEYGTVGRSVVRKDAGLVYVNVRGGKGRRRSLARVVAEQFVGGAGGKRDGGASGQEPAERHAGQPGGPSQAALRGVCEVPEDRAAGHNRAGVGPVRPVKAPGCVAARPCARLRGLRAGGPVPHGSGAGTACRAPTGDTP